MIDILMKPGRGFLFSVIVLTIIFTPIVYGDYAFLDEAHQLWHNHDGTNYSMFFVQGRWLTGLWMNFFFSHISSVSGFKIVRIFSFFSWILFLEEFFRLGRKWQERIGFDKALLPIVGIYIACCPSVAIYIGWGACFEVAIASLLGVWSGHLFFTKLIQHDERKPVFHPVLLLATLSGLASLFLYQTAFAAFLLPYILYLLEKKSNLASPIMKAGLAGYLLIAGCYYLLFLFSIHHTSLVPSQRTDFTGNIPGKLGFFFSAPLSQAFSFNLLFNVHNIPSQLFPVLMMTLWTALTFRPDKRVTWKKISFILVFIGILMLIYAPLLIGKENFASYRTMFMLNLVVTVGLLHAILSFCNNVGPLPKRNLLLLLLFCIFACTGFRNFRFNFIRPLTKEYSLLRQYFDAHYDPSVRTIYILRPPENLFFDKLSIRPYKDEFGIPSTYKYWTPEPLLKQFILESTGDRQQAEKTPIIQYTNKDSFALEEEYKKANCLYIDIPSLF